ncbi:hypothetical protein [Kozakia baliensis]|uniref:hypothetical protein n=1 Tax=Kozakia baliensis TaxID=153496 RepID=UPI00049514CA|nr:hypothetical protein [Kozakia baliensis]
MTRFLTRVWPWSEIAELRLRLACERALKRRYYADGIELSARVRALRAEIERMKAGPKRDERGRFVR